MEHHRADLSRRRFLWIAGSPAVLNASCSRFRLPKKTRVLAGSGKLEVAATSFDLAPPVGLKAPTFGDKPFVYEIQGTVETCIFALRQGDLCLGWGASDYRIHDRARACLAQALGIPVSRTAYSITHNHSTVAPEALQDLRPGSFGRQLDSEVQKAAGALRDSFVPVSLYRGTSEENSITYNRKGRREDGSTYFMREEDRVKLPGDYTGVIDPLASVLRFESSGGEPVLLLTHFTGHPVISYNLQRPVINPDYSGWAMSDLRDSCRPARPPVAFLQGCAGDVNAKGMFAGPEQARDAGRTLGRAFIRANKVAQRVEKPVLAFAEGTARIPYDSLPAMEVLEAQRRELTDFMRRAEAGDPNTLRVLGYNFSTAMEPSYRRNLARPMLQWTEWALQMQREGKSRPEEDFPLPLQAIAIGEIAIITVPCEAFVGIGLDIRKGSPFPLTLTAAYTNGVYPNYVGRSADVGDGEYMSAYYRYIQKPPYRKPAGDAITEKAVEMLDGIWKSLY